jgi:hypothetical protein
MKRRKKPKKSSRVKAKTKAKKKPKLKEMPRKEIKRKIKSKKNISLILTVIFILAILTIILFVIGSFPDKNGIAECERNSDCVKVQTTCCSCEMGGSEKCVPHGQQGIYEAKDCPEDPLCIALYNCEVKGCVCSKGGCKEIIGEKVNIKED